MSIAILAVIAWTWTIATLFLTERPQPIQAATVSVSSQDSLQVFLVVDTNRVLLDGDTELTVGGEAAAYLDNVVPLPLEVEIYNATPNRLAMRATSGPSAGIIPIFGDVPLPGSNTSVDLAPKGSPGSGVMGLLDFELEHTDSLRRRTHIEFTTSPADASQQPSLPTSLGFEDDSLGQLCSFLDADPIRDEFMESHGVSFQAGHPDDGMAVLHECGNFGLDSRSGGDYILVGNERGELANEGIPELPLTATFSQPVTVVSLWAAAGVRAGPDTLSLALTAYSNAGGSGDVVASSTLDASMQWQQLSVQAPNGKTIKSVKLTNESEVHSYLVDDMEWAWAQQQDDAEGQMRPPSCLGVSSAASH